MVDTSGVIPAEEPVNLFIPLFHPKFQGIFGNSPGIVGMPS
jgi:hypothetical protein